MNIESAISLNTHRYTEGKKDSKGKTKGKTWR